MNAFCTAPRRGCNQDAAHNDQVFSDTPRHTGAGFETRKTPVHQPYRHSTAVVRAMPASSITLFTPVSRSPRTSSLAPRRLGPAQPTSLLLPRRRQLRPSLRCAPYQHIVPPARLRPASPTMPVSGPSRAAQPPAQTCRTLDHQLAHSHRRTTAPTTVLQPRKPTTGPGRFRHAVRGRTPGPRALSS